MRPLHTFVAFLALFFVVLAGRGEARDYPALFGTREIQKTNLTNFPRWAKVLEQFDREVSSPDELCERAKRSCPMKEWRAHLRSLVDLESKAKIDAINRYMNKFPYIEDSVNWGVNDYWATPSEFLSRGGDCEDFALAKYFSLKILGFPIEQMRIVLLQDLNLRIAHAILVVYLNGRALVLDSQIKEVVPADAIYHYKPLYSINETGWWLHVR